WPVIGLAGLALLSGLGWLVVRERLVPRRPVSPSEELAGATAALLALAVVAAGFLGPLLLLGSLAWRYDLGLDAPWYLAELAATGFVKLPAIVIAVGW